MSHGSKENYLFVYVNEDGSVREVTMLEKLYLQTKYSGSDGERPYIKFKYSDQTPDGRIAGFCYREAVPGNIEIQQVVEEATKEAIETEIRRKQEWGYEIDLTGIEI